MSDQFTTVTTKSYGQRIMGSFATALLGVALFLGSFILLWWNEGNIVAEKRALEEVKESLVEGQTPDLPNASNNGKLLHLSGSLQGEGLGDELLKAGPYLILERIVKMYQWVEEKDTEKNKNLGGSEETKTTYRYKLAWHEGRVDSEKFVNPEGHLNPPLIIDSSKVTASESSFGKYHGSSVLERMSASTPLKVTDAMLNSTSFKDMDTKLEDGLVYLQDNQESSPVLGDLQVSYQVLNPGVVSVIAQQVDEARLAPYMTKQEKEKFIVYEGTKTSQAMLKSERESSQMLAHILRLAGWLLMWLALCMMAGPLSTFADILPILGSASRVVIGLTMGALALGLSAVTIVLGMLFHHPIVLLAVLVAMGGFYAFRRAKREPSAVAAAAKTQAAKSSRAS